MPNQLTLDFTNQCSECGGVFDLSALNHWDLCEDCQDILATQAEILSDISPVHFSTHHTYEAKQMGLHKKENERV